MIHFFPRFSADAASTPLGAALRATGVPHRIFSVHVTQTYARRIDLLVRGYPALAWASFRAACRSLFSRMDPPAAVTVSSDVEVLVFALVRCLPTAARARIVLMPFIFTTRNSAVVNRLRLAYYRFVMARVSLAICHSSREVADYERLFAGSGARFVFVPWGTHVPQATEILADAGVLPPATPGGLVVSAGKSGRDYATLQRAVNLVGCRLVIVCNDDAIAAAVAPDCAVQVLRDCFGQAYLRQLLAADIVAVPLHATDISAGQMVFIQAMALGRPLVVTDSPTVRDYLQDGLTALLVPPGDAGAFAVAIRRLLDDPAFAHTLGTRARAHFQAQLSGEAHQQRVVDAIVRHCGIAGPTFAAQR